MFKVKNKNAKTKSLGTQRRHLDTSALDGKGAFRTLSNI